MRLPVDDDIYHVDGVWLGPAGHTFPFRVTYRAWAVGLVLTVLLFLVELQAGIPIVPQTVTWTLAGAVLATKRFMAFVDDDHPLTALWAAFWHEVDAPRPATKSLEHTFRPSLMHATTQDGNHATTQKESD